MNLKSVLPYAALLAAATSAFSAQVAYTGIPANLQVVGLSSLDTRSQGYTMFTIPGTADANCTEFWLYPNEKNLLATLLTAKTMGVSIRATAESSALPPWNTPKSCRLEQVLIE